MAKKAVKLATFGAIPDALDIWGDKAAAAQKEAREQADRDRAALESSQSSSPAMDSEAVAAAREAERLRKQAVSGQSGTILGGAGGSMANTTGGKTLLGS